VVESACRTRHGTLTLPSLDELEAILAGQFKSTGSPPMAIARDARRRLDAVEAFGAAQVDIATFLADESFSAGVFAPLTSIVGNRGVGLTRARKR